MIGSDELILRCGSLERTELIRWIENRWVIPDEQGGGWMFHEVDVARIELILDIRSQFAVTDEVMPLVLQLLDQVYSLRRQMRRLTDALEAQPVEIRDAIRRALPPPGR